MIIAHHFLKKEFMLNTPDLQNPLPVTFSLGIFQNT